MKKEIVFFFVLLFFVKVQAQPKLVNAHDESMVYSSLVSSLVIPDSVPIYKTASSSLLKDLEITRKPSVAQQILKGASSGLVNFFKSIRYDTVRDKVISAPIGKHPLLDNASKSSAPINNSVFGHNLILSPIIFSDDAQFCVCVLLDWMGIENSTTTVFYFEKENNGWKIIRKQVVAIS